MLSLSAAVKVVSIQPEPNYKLSKSASDIDELSDKEINNYPIWTKKSSVGWQFKTPVRMHIDLNTKCQKSASGILRIHTARGTHAGVNLPRRVDVYSKVDSERYQHVKAININNSLFSDRKNHWVEVQASEVSDGLFVVVHADGQFIMIDEIEFKLTACSSEGIFSIENSILASDITKDSIHKLKTSLNKKVMLDVDHLKKNNIYIWEAPAWERLSGDFPKSDNNNNHISVVAVKGEYESFSMGLLSTYTLPKNIEVAVIETDEVVNVRNLTSIVTSNGERVWDPLIPIKGNTVLLKPGEKQYLWFTINTNTLEPGFHEVMLKINNVDSGFEFNKVVEIEIIADSTKRPDDPQVVTWSYSHDVPMKLNITAAINDQTDHGVNTFVIHPSKIPHPLKRKGWNDVEINKLFKEMQYYKGKGLILLHLGWPYWLGEISESELMSKKELIIDWIKFLNDKLNDFGMNPKEWALYPVDEPIGEEMEFLKTISPWIKSVDADIQIYANPIQTKSNSVKIKDLKYLNKYIDFWQPSLKFAKNNGFVFFSKLNKDWWTFGGPGSPVKSAMPYVYRKLSWDAWDIGAKGIGFWSYSDTKNSSAWDDFDGVRPDWAVVYESNEGPVSSRRWEAFRDGVEDFKLLIHLSKIKTNVYNTGSNPLPVNADMKVLLKERAQLINDYKFIINNSVNH